VSTGGVGTAAAGGGRDGAVDPDAPDSDPPAAAPRCGEFGDAGAAAFGAGALVSCAKAGAPIKAIPTSAANKANRVIVVSLSREPGIGHRQMRRLWEQPPA
jgi:hypothetical protein